jgi:multiple sugar transport system ATP-binding protein
MPRVEFRHICKTYPDGTRAVADLDLVVEDREFLCVLGPSGCGKSSTLRMLAGLEAITSGDLLLDGKRVNDVPPQARDMAMVFENYALYPHLRVFDNIAMPLVARGRAIVRTPRMFLMDEPLGHLEAYLRVQLRAEVRRLHERLGATTVYITHDQEESAAVSDRIAVMADGRLQQLGTLLDLLDRPVNRFVAEFIGDLPINILPASLGEGGLRVGPALLRLTPRQASALVQGGHGLSFGIRPQDVSLADAPGGAILTGEVTLLEPQGSRTVVIAETPAGRVSVVAVSHAAPPPGAPAHFRFDMERAHLFTADGVNLFHAGKERHGR